MAVIQMSQRELKRLRVLIGLSDDRLTVEAAGTLLGLRRRQVIVGVVRLPLMVQPLWCRANAAVRAITGRERPSGELL